MNSSSVVLALPLLNNSSDVHADIKGSGSNKAITTTGSPTASTTTSKFYGGSYYFANDGGDHYLSTAANSDFDFPTGTDFTIEFWIRNIHHGSGGSDGVPLAKESSGLRPNWLFYYYGGNNGELSFNSGNGSSWDNINFAIGSGMVLNRWYHAAVTRSGTTYKGYLDGVLTYTGTGASNNLNESAGIIVGKWTAARGTGLESFEGYLQDIRIYKGVVKYTSNFTVTAPAVAPIAAVSPSSIFGLGDAAATTFNPFTDDINAVMGQETGYPTFNPLYMHSGTANTYSDGNLVMTAGANNGVSLSTMSIPTSGKWYAEIIDIDSSNGAFIGGVGDPNQVFSDFLGRTATGWGYQTHATNAGYWNNNSFSTTGQINGYGSNMILNVAVDRDNGYLWFGINGVYVNGGNPSAGTGYQYSNIPLTGDLMFGGSSATGLKVGINCGQKPFKFPPPEGFQPLNYANLPSPGVVRPDQYVGVTTYTATGATGYTVFGLNFTPDMVWIKSRDAAYNHNLFDVTRPNTSTGNGYAILRPDTDGAQDVSGNFIDIVPGLHGFTALSNGSPFNEDGTNYVAWCWRAGGNKNTFNVDDVGYASAADAGLTGGDITPTGASVGTKQGFSIIKFTTDSGASGGDTVTHGLNAQPGMYIYKPTSTTGLWIVVHSFDYDQFAYLDMTTQFRSISSQGGGTPADPTNSVLTLYDLGVTLASKTYICYAWADVPGLQKFGSYIGQDSDNQFVELGFRPALVWIKATTTGTTYTSWWIGDAERNKFNPTGGANTLWANLGAGEGKRGDGSTTSNLQNIDVDFLSNGFCVTGGNSDEISDATYGPFIYAAWAEAPMNNLYGAQSNAR